MKFFVTVIMAGLTCVVSAMHDDDLENRLVRFVLPCMHYSDAQSAISHLRKEASDEKLANALYKVYENVALKSKNGQYIENALYWFGTIAPTNELFRLKDIAVNETNRYANVAVWMYIKRRYMDDDCVEFAEKILDSSGPILKRCTVWPAISYALRKNTTKVSEGTVDKFCDFAEKRLRCKTEDCINADNFLCRYRRGYKDSQTRKELALHITGNGEEQVGSITYDYFKRLCSDLKNR